MRHMLLSVVSFMLAPLTAFAGAITSFDVAPTTLDLVPGRAGLFYVSNHSGKPVTVQLQPMDWVQQDGKDLRSPSRTLMVSPEFVSIAPGARQSVRVMGTPDGDGEHAYRLVVSELPDSSEIQAGVHVLLQFSVPVFVGHKDQVPMLVWDTKMDGNKSVLTARNEGSQAVKLAGVSLNGIPQPGDHFFYVLPGATYAFAARAAEPTLNISSRDERSGRVINADVSQH